MNLINTNDGAITTSNNSLSNPYLLSIPNTLLILGTDASGKDHVANLVADTITKDGFDVYKKRGWFTTQPTNTTTSENKSLLALLLEKSFISTFPFTKFLMPLLLSFAIQIDLNLFVQPKAKTIIISHTALRVLAIYLGSVFKKEEEIRISKYLDKCLRSIRFRTGVKSIILDINDQTRKDRIRKRIKKGKSDPLDKFMAKDEYRAERIDNYLIWLGKTYLNAIKIENNNLTDSELIIQLQSAFHAFAKD
jgi:thymidylate kinase